ncbi:CocE/NonD family hydrolase [Rhodococcus erythropolis]|uniref:CocE/NonD family hydrolase n=1 Tax=Rhodococcus erythropolis TaxID=1833 RepID=UPI0029491B78|nr:CocE/NonD family hydrolase [Rhodococcus erythropolis]MDV6212731.1 CocE/NonD family hydrolase [Rhodococcus erythropolis]
MRAAGRPTSLIMGPWTHINYGGHIGQMNFGLAASADLMGFRGRRSDIETGWLKKQLSEEEPDGEGQESDLPPVLLFVMGGNQWREENEWPLARAVDTELYLHEHSHLSFEAPNDAQEVDTFSYDPADPVPTTGRSLLMAEDFPAGPFDQAAVEARSDVLVYTSEPLADDLEVTGRIQASIFVTTDAPTTDWVVRLCDVGPDGVSRNIVDGIRRVQAAPDEYTEQHIDLWSTSYVFAAGHRLRLQVTSSNFPRWYRNLNTGTNGDATQMKTARQRVAHDVTRPSRLVLPIIPAKH